MAAHDPAHRRVRQVVPDGLVEILTAHAADDARALDHEDSTLAMSLAESHRIANGVVGTHRARRRGHDVPCAAGRAVHVRVLRARPRAPRRGSYEQWPMRPEHGPPPPSAVVSTDASMSSVRLRATAKTRPSISTSTTSARASVRSTILCARFEMPSTYSGQRTAANRISSPWASTGSRVLERVEQVALGSGERSVQIRGDEILPGAVAQAPGERIGVALRARGIRE